MGCITYTLGNWKTSHISSLSNWSSYTRQKTTLLRNNENPKLNILEYNIAIDIQGDIVKYRGA